jgi:hypothetical protein
MRHLQLLITKKQLTFWNIVMLFLYLIRWHHSFVSEHAETLQEIWHGVHSYQRRVLLDSLLFLWKALEELLAALITKQETNSSSKKPCEVRLNGLWRDLEWRACNSGGFPFVCLSEVTTTGHSVLHLLDMMVPSRSTNTWYVDLLWEGSHAI